jgi:hypothetical protein
MDVTDHKGTTVFDFEMISNFEFCFLIHDSQQIAFYRSCCEHTPLAFVSKLERAAWPIKRVGRSRGAMG